MAALMKLLLVGHGKMGRMVESIARDYGFEVAGAIDPMSPAHGGGPDAAAWNGVDVAVDFSTADSVPVNAPALLRRGISGFAKIAQADTNQPKTLLRAEIYSLA